MDTKKRIIIAAIAAIIVTASVFAGAFVIQKRATEEFLSDFNAMNAHYKQALFQTGQANRETALFEYEQFISSINDFYTKYEKNRPGAMNDDIAFNTDIERVKALSLDARYEVTEGNLSVAHTKLEAVRPIFNELMRRNGMSMLSVALVDFHDSMELVMDAGDDKDAALVLERYTDADMKLKAVESELDDEGVQNIRAQLDKMKELAENGNIDELPSQASKLKSSYVKVYLEKG